MDPVWNYAGIQQIIGRGVRCSSHAHLPPEERFVNVYKMVLVNKDFDRDDWLNNIDETTIEILNEMLKNLYLKIDNTQLYYLLKLYLLLVHHVIFFFPKQYDFHFSVILLLSPLSHLFLNSFHRFIFFFRELLTRRKARSLCNRPIFF